MLTLHLAPFSTNSSHKAIKVQLRLQFNNCWWWSLAPLWNQILAFVKPSLGSCSQPMRRQYCRQLTDHQPMRSQLGWTLGWVGWDVRLCGRLDAFKTHGTYLIIVCNHSSFPICRSAISELYADCTHMSCLQRCREHCSKLFMMIRNILRAKSDQLTIILAFSPAEIWFCS